MLKIAHLADVHVRSLSRHDELKVVFEDFAKKCVEQKIDHVFIGGDLFHTKASGMSPECIEFMCWWLGSLAKIVPVHIILGNHDGVLSNLTRQDAISPIVIALDSPNIHLYKKSGVYEFAPGYNWCVFSLFDEEGWKDVRPIPGMVNIACYHGPVWGAVTETEWVVDEGMKIDFFKDYTFTFLGDIHRRQYLAAREVELEIDERDLYKYPGAMVIT